jgi:hypothetical protein
MFFFKNLFPFLSFLFSGKVERKRNGAGESLCINNMYKGKKEGRGKRERGRERK